MSPQEFRKLIKKLGMSQMRASRVLGVNGRTVRRWVRGDSPVPKSVELVILMLVDRDLTDDQR